VIAPPAKLPVKAGPVPDKLSIWPMDDGRFGLDASFQGANAAQRAYAHEWELIASEVPHSFRQDATGAWTLRFGPLSAHDLTCALDAFVH
jgi:hypothetical protein